MGGSTHWLPDGPVREALGITEVPEVVDVAEELVLQLGVLDNRHGTVLVGGPRVALQPWGEVSDVGGNLLYHHPAHLAVPDGLRRVELSQESLTELVSICREEEPAVTRDLTRDDITYRGSQGSRP